MLPSTIYNMKTRRRGHGVIGRPRPKEIGTKPPKFEPLRRLGKFKFPLIAAGVIASAFFIFGIRRQMALNDTLQQSNCPHIKELVYDPFYVRFRLKTMEYDTTFGEYSSTTHDMLSFIDFDLIGNGMPIVSYVSDSFFSRPDQEAAMRHECRHAEDVRSGIMLDGIGHKGIIIPPLTIDNKNIESIRPELLLAIVEFRAYAEQIKWQKPGSEEFNVSYHYLKGWFERLILSIPELSDLKVVDLISLPMETTEQRAYVLSMLKAGTALLSITNEYLEATKGTE